MRFIFVLTTANILFTAMMGCGFSEQKVDTKILSSAELPYKANLLPGIHEADSAYILYYHKPGDHRFYSTTRITDKKSLEPLMKAANETIIPDANDCVTRGKIHLYAKEGKLYTLYFQILIHAIHYRLFIRGRSITHIFPKQSVHGFPGKKIMLLKGNFPFANNYHMQLC